MKFFVFDYKWQHIGCINVFILKGDNNSKGQVWELVVLARIARILHDTMASCGHFQCEPIRRWSRGKRLYPKNW